MEEPFSCSLNICSSLIENTIIKKASQKLPPSKAQIRTFSSQKAERVTNMLLTTSKHRHDSPAPRLSQDHEIKNTKSNSFKIHNLRKPSTASSLQSEDKEYKGSKTLHHRISSKFYHFGLVPLEPAPDISDESEQQEEDIEQKMREIKMHQEHIRTRYMETVKQSFKQTRTKNKQQGKHIPKTGVYDYDGTIIEAIKPDAIKFPTHYLEVDVNVQSKENILSKGVIQQFLKKKPKKTVKFESYTKNKDQLRVSQSSFLKQFTNLKLAEGVEICSSAKDDTRKIIGYTQPARKLRKKKINILKPSQELKNMRLADLQDYRGMVRFDSSGTINIPSEQICGPQKKCLSNASSAPTDEAEKTIKINNERALDFLIKDEIIELPTHTSKKSGFATSKKGVHSFYE